MIKEIDPSTSPLVAAAMGEEGDLVELRLARGCRCFGAWLDSDLAGYGWLSTGPEWIGELELEIRPNLGEGYIWNCVTLEHQRRRGVLRALLAGIRSRAHEEGLNRLWIGSVAIPAEKAFGPSGFAPALVLASEVIAGYRWLQVRPAAGADLALVEAAHRVIAVPAGRSLRVSHPRRH
ncbi:MAG: GNAT family N-acetyltransferase [Candidatus Dormibacteraeota bacterium]|nr:GNAT family N-acetyltransferase [Candidatus Dormibacteraeota bacterium]